MEYQNLVIMPRITDTTVVASSKQGIVYRRQVLVDKEETDYRHNQGGYKNLEDKSNHAMTILALTESRKTLESIPGLSGMTIDTNQMQAHSTALNPVNLS